VSKIDRAAVRAGAFVAISVCLPVAVLGKLLVKHPDSSAWTPVVFVAVMLGFATGGWVSAQRTRETPYASAGMGALLAFVVIEIASIVSLLIRDKEIQAVLIVANAFFAYAAGLFGAAVEVRQRKILG
jgi:uncharacterized spore protein YtfJ